MAKLVLFDDDAFTKIKAGVEQQNRAVGATLGPRAHNVIFKRPFGAPGVVHDGVTVSKELDPPDQFEAAAQEIVKGAASATNDEAGDGTTTATILVYSLFNEGRKLVTAGHNAQILKRGVEAATELIVDKLKESATPIKDNKQQLEVAIIASQNEKVGKEVAKAFEKLGNDAVIAVEESKHNYIYSEYKDGMEIDQGYMNRYFITSNEFDEAAIEDANIIVTDFSLSSGIEIQKVLESMTEAEINDNLVIISPDVKEVALAVLIHNKMRGLHLLAVRAPGYGDEQAERLEDIAISVGGKFISQSSGYKLDEIPKDAIGHAQKVVATRETTTIVNGAGDPALIKARVELIDKRIKKEGTSEFEVERLQERKAKLTSGVAIINVGARNEGEAKMLKECTIDAVGAIKAANELGIVAGGETALLRASWKLNDTINKEPIFSKLPAEELAGYRLVAKSMEAPFKRLMENCGLEPGQMLERLLHAEGKNQGIDAIDGKVKNLIKAGIIDPVKVPISALQNAVSAAMSLLTSGVIIADEVKDKESDVV
jgi:chaperonin GroEL